MEMFNKKVLDGRIGPLKKNTNLDDLEQVEGYVIRKASEAGLETSYDVMAEEMPYFKTMGYTSYGTSFIMQPLNLKFRTEQIADAYNDEDVDILDWSGYLNKNIKDKQANKYQDRRKVDTKKYPYKDYLVVLPGSNKLKEIACLNKMIAISKKYKHNIWFKPHPITKHQFIGELQDLFGEEAILHRDMDLYHFLVKAKKVYTTHVSESALYSIILGKDIEPIDVWQTVHRGSFHHINAKLYDTKSVKWIDKTFSSPKSGVINPNVDKDWKKKVDQYFEYILAKRHYYKDWFIDNRKPKNKKK